MELPRETPDKACDETDLSGVELFLEVNKACAWAIAEYDKEDT